MNILIIGSGGREHTLAWKIEQSPICKALFIAKGNAGTGQIGLNVDLAEDDFDAISHFIGEYQIDMVVVGPEAPLVKGIYDYIKEVHPKVIVIGPSAAAAQLEGSKAYAKDFMASQNIPTASFGSFTRKTLSQGLEFLEKFEKGPYVLKADGLAAGKGVLIISDLAEAKASLTEMLEGQFGEASSTVVIESFLDGIEFSVFVLTDGTGYVILPEAKDYKRIGEGDTGLNTGGMGSISPVPFFDTKMRQKVISRIIEPTLAEIQKRRLTYKGFIFFGLITVDGEPYVIEYNCRLGDPETQSILPRIKNDLVDLFLAVENGTIGSRSIDIDQNCATSVVMVSGGYPEAYEKGKEIVGIEAAEESHVFMAGAQKIGDQIVTSGGRVLAVTSIESTISKALEKSYDSASKIAFEGCYYRSDLGFDL